MDMSLVSYLVVGAVAGWLAGQIMRGRGFGCIGNVIIGLVGAVIGGYVFSTLGWQFGTGLVNDIGTALVGAMILLGVANVLGGGRK